MPFITALLAGLTSIAGPLAVRVLTGLGVGVATYSGVKALLDMLLSEVQTNMNSLGGQLLQFAAVFNLDRAIMIIFSAYTVRLTFMGMTAAGILTRMQWRTPTAGGG